MNFESVDRPLFQSVEPHDELPLALQQENDHLKSVRLWKFRNNERTSKVNPQSMWTYGTDENQRDGRDGAVASHGRDDEVDLNRMRSAHLSTAHVMTYDVDEGGRENDRSDKVDHDDEAHAEAAYTVAVSKLEFIREQKKTHRNHTCR